MVLEAPAPRINLAAPNGDIYIYIYKSNPALINPKRLFNWEGIKKVSYYHYLEGTPITKPWFINPGIKH